MGHVALGETTEPSRLQHQAPTDEMLVEQELTRRGLRLRFAPEMELRFESETSAARSRMLFYQELVALFLYLSHSLTDLSLVPDVAPLALVLHFGIGLPASMVVLVLLWFNPRPVLRESLAIGITMVGALLTLAVMLASDAPLRDQLATSTLVMLLFITVVQRVRFPYAVVASVVLIGANAASLSLLGDYDPARLVSDIGTLIGGGALMLVASWTLERESRRAYLLRFKERLLNTALDDMSRHDPMTGLENRRSLDLAFGAIARDANRGEDIAVVLLDIDHFKIYNDTLGHMAGDEALRIVARELRAGLRAGTDRAFRFGGEEFLLLLRRTSLSEAGLLAERLRRRIEAAALPHPRADGAVVTASFGVASARTGGDIGSDEMVAGADAALYAAKRAGRNQVWPPLPASRADERPAETPIRDAG
jgi:diguanylate cyclase (GGDEF)-like protein